MNEEKEYNLLRIPLSDGSEYVQEYSDLEVEHEVKDDCVEVKISQFVTTTRIPK